MGSDGCSSPLRAILSITSQSPMSCHRGTVLTLKEVRIVYLFTFVQKVLGSGVCIQFKTVFRDSSTKNENYPMIFLIL